MIWILWLLDGIIIFYFAEIVVIRNLVNHRLLWLHLTLWHIHRWYWGRHESLGHSHVLQGWWTHSNRLLVVVHVWLHESRIKLVLQILWHPPVRFRFSGTPILIVLATTSAARPSVATAHLTSAATTTPALVVRAISLIHDITRHLEGFPFFRISGLLFLFSV